MKAQVFHGTTSENVAGIKRRGLPKGAFVSTDRAVAQQFANLRASWNHQQPVVLTAEARIENVRRDRSNRIEARLTERTKGWRRDQS